MGTAVARKKMGKKKEDGYSEKEKDSEADFLCVKRHVYLYGYAHLL